MKRVNIFFAVLFCILAFSGCAKEDTVEVPPKRIPGEAAEYTGTEYITVGEGRTMRLLLMPSTGNIRWQQKMTGEYFETKLFDSGLSEPDMLSDLVVHYYTGSRTHKYISYTDMDSYSYGVEMPGISYEKIDQGVRIVYRLVSSKIDHKDFPAYISEERMEELVLQYLDERQRNLMSDYYQYINTGIYARISSSDFPLVGLGASQLYEFFYESGHYTYDELVIDNITYEIKEEEYPVKQDITTVMEYYLDEDDLVVRVPAGGITFAEEFPLRSLDILPYFLSSDEKDGYLFVPDGSGALIYLDNTQLNEFQFTAEYFGGNILSGADAYKTNGIYMSCPVYGIKTGNKAVLGIIEKGAEAAVLNAYISGYYGGNPYSRVSLSFDIRRVQTLSSFLSDYNSYNLLRVPEDHYDEDIVIRYCFLSGDDADYAGMAGAYQNYLLQRDGLAVHEPEETAPLFIEFLGAVDKKKYFLGIPYNGTEVLTTFRQAEDILGSLYSQGIQNFAVEWNAAVNGGYNQRAVKNGVQVEDVVGGKKGMEAFIQYAGSIGAEVYPKIKLQTASTDKGLTKAQRSFFLNESIARIYPVGIVSGLVDDSDPYAEYIVSPSYMPAYMKQFIKSYQKLGIPNLSSGDFMTFLSADYGRKEHVSMSSAVPYYMEALDMLADEYALMLSHPLSYAYGRVRYLTDIPTKSSLLKIEDASVPFLQMVLDGCVTYSTEKLNESSYDLTLELMKAIETKSALKFQFISADPLVLQATRAEALFMVEYSPWESILAEYYMEYDRFYQKVKYAKMTEHEIVGRDNRHIAVTYSNGVKVLLNYGEEAADIHGIAVPAFGYMII